jgi:hypothetical protein
MGFLDHTTNNIILDAVLTDEGRRRLSRSDGSFAITNFAMADDEVDYTIIRKFGRTVGKEKIEKNTPVLEANTNASEALRYRAISARPRNLLYLPTFTISPSITSVTLNIINARTKKLAFTIEANNGASAMDPTVVMQMAEIKMDYRFLAIQGARPATVNRDNIATYVCPRDAGANTSTNATTVTKTFQIAPTITSADWNLYGTPADKSVIESVVQIRDMTGGAFSTVVFRIKKTDN